MKTWKVIEVGGMTPAGKISLCCPKCGTDAVMPIAKIKSPVIAAIGLSLIFDDPSYRQTHNVLPKIIKCRYCRAIFEAERRKEQWE